MLKLRIENFDQLPDGGPIEFAADRRGFDFGRDQHLDWTLPDQTGVISRKHCEVRFFEQAYWLFDMSTNGTFVNRSAKRVQSPYRLNDGDELRIGEYIVSVKLLSTEPSPLVLKPERATPAFHAPRGGNLWDTDDVAPPPIDPRELMPPQPEIRRAPDYLQQIVELPPVIEPAQLVKPVPPRAPYVPPSAMDIWNTAPASAPEAGVPAPDPQHEPREVQAAPPPRMPPPARAPREEQELPFRPSLAVSHDEPGPSPVPLSIDSRQSAPQLSDMPAATSSASNSELLQRLAKGAGVSPDVFRGRDSGDVAEEVGQLLNLFCGNLMRLLNARAAAKTVSKSGSRTLIQSRDNNPLKFMPTAEEALRIMLAPPTPSYLSAQKSVEGGFHDIQSHQLAMLAAMQRAASDLLESISPDAIRKAAGEGKKSLLPVGKGRYWETFTEIWEAKAAGKDYGMLSAFLDAFAARYDEETRGK